MIMDSERMRGMTNKMVSAVYGILSAAVWGGTMALLLFIIILFCTGEKKAPTFELEAITVSAADINDADFRECSARADGWYKIEYNAAVSGARFSPYTYTVKNVVFNAPEGMNNSLRYLMLCGDEIEYSALTSDTFTITLYVNSGTREAAREIALTSAFGFRGVKQRFAFLEKELVINLPGFSVSDFDTEPVLL